MRSVWLVVLCACSSSVNSLRIDVRTDITSDEFTSARVEVFVANPDGSLGSEAAAREVQVRGEDWYQGVRLFSAELPRGQYVAFLHLLNDARDSVVPIVPLRVRVRGRLAHTFRVSRECLGQEEACMPPDCAAATDCEDRYACGVAECSAGVCLYNFDDDLCVGGRCTPDGCVGAPDASADVGTDVPVDVPADATCPPDFADCNDDIADGCETELGTLGACRDCEDRCFPSRAPFVGSSSANHECDESRTCRITFCDVRLADCNGVFDDGCETDITTATNCGGCGTVCPPERPVCGVTEDPENPTLYFIRECQTACPPETPINCAGTCVAAVTGGRDIFYSPSHCTGCGVTCGAPDYCCGGCCATRGTSGCTLC